MSESDRRPDAVRLPFSWRGDGHPFLRSNRVLDHAAHLLGTDADGGGAYAAQDGDMWFCFRDIRETPRFPTGHPRAGQPRYRWESRPDGTQFGFYVDEEAAHARPQA